MDISEVRNRVTEALSQDEKFSGAIQFDDANALGFVLDDHLIVLQITEII